MNIRRLMALSLITATIFAANFAPANAEPTGEANASATSGKAVGSEKVRLTWPIVPGAVQYQVVILKNQWDAPVNILLTRNRIFTNGVEIDISEYADQKPDLFWKVCPLDFEGRPVGKGFSAVRPLMADGKFNTVSPLPTTEFDKMDEMPLYPVYSWIPFLNADSYRVQVYKKEGKGEKLLKEVTATGFNYPDETSYTSPGDYCWRIRAVGKNGAPLGEWSEKIWFAVKPTAKVAALGDSITHGGGAMSVPSGYVLYNWETYSPVPVKNLGHSGDTIAMLLERFDRDVLPFKPQILVVMGGVNDYRETTTTWSSVRHLTLIRDKCKKNNIVPVFVTAPPISASKIALRGMQAVPYGDWRVRQHNINEWVKQQKYWLDICPALTDERGELKSVLTTDGLHPDNEAKAYIGENIGNYILSTFPHLFRDTANS